MESNDIGVSHLSPSTDVVCKTKQGYSLSPIGSPLPETSTSYLKPQQNSMKSYDLFCSKSPEIANLIDVVSPQNSDLVRDYDHNNWESESISSPSIPSVSSIPSVPSIHSIPSIPSDYNLFKVPHPSEIDPALIYKLDKWTLVSHSPPLTPPLISSSPILSASPITRPIPPEQHWTEEWILDQSAPVSSVLLNDYNNSSLGTKTLSAPAIWVDEDSRVPSNYPYTREELTNPAEYLLTRGRSNSHARSRSSSGSVSPHAKYDDGKRVLGCHSMPHMLSPPDSPPPTSPEIPIPTPPRKISRIPFVSPITRARISTLPGSTRGYVAPRPIYPIEFISDLQPTEVSMVPVTHTNIPNPSPAVYPLHRGFHCALVGQSSSGDELDGKSRSRSAGEVLHREKSGKSIPSSPNHHRYRHKAKMARHRRASIKDEDLSRYELVVKRVLSGQDTRTTLMIKNIPNKYDQEMLLEAINHNFKGTYDFFYLPIDFKNKCNVGYAFINFINYLTVASFHEEFDQKKWEKFNSEKVCKITFARIQGKAAFIDHFRNSSLMYEDQACRPLIFHSSGPSIGQLENFPPANALRSRSSENIDDDLVK